MEDVRIGRKVLSAIVPFSATTGVTWPIPGNPMRVSIILCAVGAGRITYSPGQSAVLDAGITLSSSTGPMVLDVDRQGDAVTGPWSVIASGAGQSAYIESYLAEQ